MVRLPSSEFLVRNDEKSSDACEIVGILHHDKGYGLLLWNHDPLPVVKSPG
jgi:hypothetical protein